MSKRALVVDDSRSARVILSRMLEGYGLEVDAAESAEQALEYLRQAHPDVIFMDHLMPGMDGFQAVQAIKSNPATAMIPVMMYTSQEGDLYVSQARALGATGVLPKTVKQIDVSRVLYQLHLLPERRDELDSAAREHGTSIGEAANAVEIEAAPPPTVGELEAAIRSAISPALQEQSSELRRFVGASLESLLRRTRGDTRPPASEDPLEPVPVEVAHSPTPKARWPLYAAAALLALLPTVVLAVLYLRTMQTTQALTESNARLASVIAAQQVQLANLASEPAVRSAARTQVERRAVTESEPVPYGEQPLSGPRLERLRNMLEQLQAQGFRGKVKVATYAGEFCLTGNGAEGYSIAADDLPRERCDLIGNPYDDGLIAAQRQSLAFANLLASVRKQAKAMTIEIAHGGRKPAVAYPEGERLSRLTAGEWNRVAQANNRVEFATEPAER